MKKLKYKCNVCGCRQMTEIAVTQVTTAKTVMGVECIREGVLAFEYGNDRKNIKVEEDIWYRCANCGEPVSDSFNLEKTLKNKGK